MNIYETIGLILAALLSYLALLQYRLERNRVILELFDRRWAVYKATYDFISSLSQKPDRIEESLTDYLRKTEQSKFLFDKNVEAYFQNLKRRAIEMNEAHAIMRQSNDSSDRQGASAKYFELQRGFIDELDRLATALEPFLSFREFRKASWRGKW